MQKSTLTHCGLQADSALCDEMLQPCQLPDAQPTPAPPLAVPCANGGVLPGASAARHQRDRDRAAAAAGRQRTGTLPRQVGEQASRQRHGCGCSIFDVYRPASLWEGLISVIELETLAASNGKFSNKWVYKQQVVNCSGTAAKVCPVADTLPIGNKFASYL